MIDDEGQFEFEILNSHDGKIITLVCRSDKELHPLEYADAIVKYAERIKTLVSLSEFSNNSIN